jgi:hypothetical protein
VRLLIRRGWLRAIDVGPAGRQRLRLTPDAVHECESRLAVSRPRRRQAVRDIDPTIARLLA